MKSETEVNAEIRYAQGYLDGLRFSLDKTESEAKTVVPIPLQDRYKMEKARFFAPVGITAGLATFFFGNSARPRDCDLSP